MKYMTFRATMPLTPHQKMALMTYVREYFARVKVFVDILTGKEPATYEKGE